MKLKLASLLAGGAMMLGSVVTVMSIAPPAQAKVPSGQIIVLEDLTLSEKQQLSSLRESKPVASQSKSVRNNRHGDNGQTGDCPPGSDCDP